MPTVTALFPTILDAENAFRALQERGVPESQMSLLARHAPEVAAPARREGAHAAGEGAAVGAGVGLVAGLAAILIPGIGPLIAIGPLATVLAGTGVGAAAGGLFGGLVAEGVPSERAQNIEEGVREGHTALIVRVPDEVSGVRAILEARHAYSVTDHADASQAAR